MVEMDSNYRSNKLILCEYHFFLYRTIYMNPIIVIDCVNKKPRLISLKEIDALVMEGWALEMPAIPFIKLLAVAPATS